MTDKDRDDGDDGLLDELRRAAVFLTRLPVERLLGEEPLLSLPPLAEAARAFPVVGAAIGLIGGLALLLAASLGLPPFAIALVGLAAMTAATGALHEDGLADTADGLWGGATPERRIEIMRDSRTGAYGVLALVFSVGLRTAALANIVMVEGSWQAAAVLIGVAALSRAVLPPVMRGLPRASTTGLAAAAGTPAQDFAATAAAIGVAVALLCLGFGAGIVAIAAAALAAWALAELARRRIGGYTGDLLGAVQQTAETAALLAAAAVL